MPIPPIPSYSIPAADDVPSSALDWCPDPRRAVLVVHDMQQYFLDPFDASQPPRADLEQNLIRLRKTAIAYGMPVVYTAQPGNMTPEQRGLLADFWGTGMRCDDGRSILPALAPQPDDIVLTKWRYSAFHATDFDEQLAAAGRDQVIVTGVYANTGCLVTAVDAFSRDLETFFVCDAMADFSQAEHRQAVHYAASRCAVVTDTARVCADLSRTDAPVGDREEVDHAVVDST